MADTFSQASTFSSDTAAFDIRAFYALRPQLFFDAVADVKPTQVTHRGSSVQFQIYTDLSAQTSTLSETSDPDAIAASDSTVTVTPAEHGAVIKTTAKLRATSFRDIDSDMLNLLGFNAGLSLDTLAQSVLKGGTNVVFGDDGSDRPTASGEVESGDVITASVVREVRAALVKANVPPVNGPLYWGFIHPDVAVDLREETGTAAWREPHTYSAPELIWSGEIGAFEGIRWVETPRAPLDSDGGSGNVDLYHTIVGGKQALALGHWNSEGYGRFPTIVRGPMVDALQRIQPLGWRWAGQYKRFREASLRRIESSANLGDNS